MLRFNSTVLSNSAEEGVVTEVITNSTGNCCASVLFRPAQNAVTSDVLNQLKYNFQLGTPSSALELHQFAEMLGDQAHQFGVEMNFVMALVQEEKSIFAARNGAIILKRGEKVGRILIAAEDIIVVEGSQKEMDDFIWLTGKVSDASTEWIKQKLTYFSQQGFEFPELQKQWGRLIAETPAEFQQLSIVSLAYIKQEEVQEAVAQPYHHSDEQSALTSPSVTSQTFQPTAAPAHGEVKKPFKVPSLNIRHFFSFFQRSFFYIKQFFQRLYSNLFSQDVFVRQQNRKKVMRILLPIIVLVVVGVITFVVISSQRRQQVQAAQQAFQPLNDRLTEIKKTVDDNPIVARQKTEDVIVDLEHAIEREKDHKITVNELTKRLQETRQFYDSISGKEEFSVLPTFYDLRYVESSFLANKVDIVDNTMVFLDQGQKKILAVNAENKQYTSLPIGDLSVLKDMDFEGKSLYLLGDGIYEFKVSESEPAVQLKAADDQLQNAQLIRFFNQYMYVLNPEKRNIFRYSFTDKTTLSDAAGWLKGGSDLEFDKVQSLSIDGDVWISTKDGKIKKFTSGKEADFTITGIPEAFSGPITLYTNQELNNLYVLEPGKDRFVVLNKKGEFLREVKSSSLKSTTTLVASEKMKKAFAVSGALVFEISL